ncbi:lytic transglycosylase domain-containing protein [Chromobacterium sp. IIBBL 290-4]|uniref:lytic transglycosylase domain-containing protein n=1 Tax=Chromobacterium sp. IIBBL 290-4 TaxID=2953890 RepID=UPI0020B84284|nr:lytic transglycosylase domain-containing protein [Chromobacterium sp. IIBBL 290-4]UTH74248.1 lytic transglycosylase domain-containing protein [Chromobacterium sp. IIBBL 290-4]
MTVSIRLCRVAFAMICAAQAEASCFNLSGGKYGVDPLLLKAIAWQESDFRSITHPANRNGSVDIGWMGINTGWLPTLSRWGITRERLLSDACLNVQTGAWVLQQCMKAHGATWKAVGCYNARSAVKQQRYVGLIWQKWQRLQRGERGDIADTSPEVRANSVDTAWRAGTGG